MKTNQHLVIITGHTSGLGHALLEACLRDKAHVLGIARRRLDLQHTHLKQIQADLSNAEPTVEQWLQPMNSFFDTAAFDTVTLVNNAGSMHPVGFLGNLDAAAIASTLHINLTIPLQLSNWLLRKFPQRALRIAHISSGASHKVYPGWGTYCSSKAGLRMAAQVMSAEAVMNGRDLRVLLYEPGVIDTPMQADLRTLDAKDFPPVERFHQLHQSGQLISAQESARELWQLLSSPELPAFIETRYGAAR